MSRDPQDEIWIGMKFNQQIAAGYDRVGADSGRVTDKFNRYVRRDDHELVLSLPPVQFMHQPGQLIGIQTSLPNKIEILVRHGIVEHNDLERQVRLRLEAVTGKVIGDVGLVET